MLNGNTILIDLADYVVAGLTFFIVTKPGLVYAKADPFKYLSKDINEAGITQVPCNQVIVARATFQNRRRRGDPTLPSMPTSVTLTANADLPNRLVLSWAHAEQSGCVEGFRKWEILLFADNTDDGEVSTTPTRVEAIADTYATNTVTLGGLLWQNGYRAEVGELCMDGVVGPMGSTTGPLVYPFSPPASEPNTVTFDPLSLTTSSITFIWQQGGLNGCDALEYEFKLLDPVTAVMGTPQGCADLPPTARNCTATGLQPDTLYGAFKVRLLCTDSVLDSAWNDYDAQWSQQIEPRTLSVPCREEGAQCCKTDCMGMMGCVTCSGTTTCDDGSLMPECVCQSVGLQCCLSSVADIVFNGVGVDCDAGQVCDDGTSMPPCCGGACGQTTCDMFGSTCVWDCGSTILSPCCSTDLGAACGEGESNPYAACVGEFDPWCLTNGWDAQCKSEAMNECGLMC